MAVRVTIVGSTDPGLEGLLRESGLEPSRVSAEGLAALISPTAQQPDILIVDLRNDPQIPAVLTALKRQHPTTGVLMLASTLDPALMLEAMRAGVTECLTDPVSRKDIEGAIARIRGSAPVVRAKVYGFVGSKGGVGTTTVAVNVATALAQLTKSRTLLIDLHLAHGDAALLLGGTPRFSVVDALENAHRFDEAYFGSLVVETRAGVDLLASSERPMTAPVDVRALRRLIEFASSQYDYVLLDIPRSDTTVLDALDVVSKLVLVANQELSAVRSASRLASNLRQRYGRENLMVVITRFDEASMISIDEVERAVGSPVAFRFPSDYRLVLDALNQGIPLVVEGGNRLADAFVKFARQLAGLPAAEEERRSGGFLGLLAGRR